MAVTQRSLTLVILVAAMVAATPTTPTPTLSSSCAGRLFGLHVSAKRNATGHNNMKAQLEQAEDASWDLDLTAEERSAAIDGKRRRLTTIMLSSEPDVAVLGEEEDNKGVWRLVKELNASNAALTQRLAALEAAMQRLVVASTPAPPPPRKVTSQERTALSVKLLQAARAGRVGKVHWLAAQGADLQYKDGSNKDSMYEAAAQGHLETLRALIESGANIDARTYLGETAMLAAAYYDHPECVAELVEAGADVDLADDRSKTPLLWAAQQGNEVCVRVLLDAGADRSKKDNGGHSPASVASTQAVRDLLSRAH